MRKILEKRTTGNTLTEGQKAELLHGFSFPGDIGFDSKDDMRKAYFQHRTYILSLIGGESFEGFSYGKRPYAWWQFENLPEERKIISYFKSDNSVNKTPMPIYESEFQFLKRNNLLIPYEEEKYHELQKRQRVTV